LGLTYKFFILLCFYLYISDSRRIRTPSTEFRIRLHFHIYLNSRTIEKRPETTVLASMLLLLHSCSVRPERFEAYPLSVTRKYIDNATFFRERLFSRQYLGFQLSIPLLACDHVIPLLTFIYRFMYSIKFFRLASFRTPVYQMVQDLSTLTL
jgi:hypothetical protein